MQSVVLVLWGLALLGVGAQELSVNQQWQVWKKDHKRLFATEEEETRRFGIWRDNLAAIEEHNGLNSSFKLKMNHFGDLVITQYL